MNRRNVSPTLLELYSLPEAAPEVGVSTDPQQSSNLNGSRSLRCFTVLWAILAALAWPSVTMARTGQPLAYVTSSNSISVIDTGDNNVVDTIFGPASPTAVAPDGKHVYAFGPSTSELVLNISEIDTTDDMVVATIPLDGSLVGAVAFQNPSAIAVTPDGQHTYLTKFDPYYGLPQVLVFDTGNSILLPGDSAVDAIAITPDGRHAYVPYIFFDDTGNVAIIDTATNAVVKTI